MMDGEAGEGRRNIEGGDGAARSLDMTGEPSWESETKAGLESRGIYEKTA